MTFSRHTLSEMNILENNGHSMTFNVNTDYCKIIYVRTDFEFEKKFLWKSHVLCETSGHAVQQHNSAHF